MSYIKKLNSKFLHGFLIILSCCAIVSCANLLPQIPPSSRVALHPSTMPLTGSKVIDKQVVIHLPKASSILETDSIVILLNNREYRHLAGYKWEAFIPKLFQQSILNAFEDSNSFKVVLSDSSGINGQISLVSELKDFTLVYHSEGSNPTARVSGIFYIVDPTTGKVVNTLSFHEEVNALGSTDEDFSVAFEKALSNIFAKTIPWVRESAIKFK